MGKVHIYDILKIEESDYKEKWRRMMISKEKDNILQEKYEEMIDSETERVYIGRCIEERINGYIKECGSIKIEKPIYIYSSNSPHPDPDSKEIDVHGVMVKLGDYSPKEDFPLDELMKNQQAIVKYDYSYNYSYLNDDYNEPILTDHDEAEVEAKIELKDDVIKIISYTIDGAYTRNRDDYFDCEQQSFL